MEARPAAQADRLVVGVDGESVSRAALLGALYLSAQPGRLAGTVPGSVARHCAVHAGGAVMAVPAEAGRADARRLGGAA